MGIHNAFEHGTPDERTPEQIVEIARLKYHNNVMFHNAVDRAVILAFAQPWSAKLTDAAHDLATTAAAIALVINQSNGAF